MACEPTNYRPDIDGLRAISVLAVVLYHSKLPFAPGGYVGVDVFFVISGFLITRLLLNDLSKGQFSVLSFYERRVRRIFPALFLVLAVTYGFSLLILLPREFTQFSRSLIACVTFISNLWFYRRGGYFEQPAENHPLLHTWSLSVEEQFYLVAPIVLALCFPRGRRFTFLVVAMAAGISLAASAWTNLYSVNAAFFLTPFRAWELLLGSSIALMPHTRPSARFAESWSLIGIAALFAGISAPASMISPWFNTLLGCFGAACLIYFGRPELTTTRTLAVTPMVFIGKCSYSLYLWHWPALVLARRYLLRDLYPAELLSLLIGCFFVSYLSWKLVEQPFRRAQWISRGPLFAVSALGTVVLLVASIASVKHGGFPHRFGPDTLRFAGAAQGSNPRRAECHSTDNYISGCNYGAPVKPRYAIWGDSHATEIVIGMGGLAFNKGQSIKQISESGCPPALNFTPEFRPDCSMHNASVLRYLLANKDISTVFLIARYRRYMTNDLQADHFEHGFKETVGWLVRSGKSVIVIGPVPAASAPVPEALARYWERGRPPTDFVIRQADFQNENSSVFALLTTITKEYPIEYVAPSDALCGPQECVVYADGKILYFDDHHLSVDGAMRVAPLFSRFF